MGARWEPKLGWAKTVPLIPFAVSPALIAAPQRAADRDAPGPPADARHLEHRCIRLVHGRPGHVTRGGPRYRRGQLPPVDPYYVAVAHLGLGDGHLAMEWLERCYAERSPSTLHFRSDPLLGALRREAAFRKLIQRLGFPST